VQAYIRYLRRKFPEAKFVCYYTDIISTLDNKPEEIRSLFDLILTYDKEDARTYNLYYFPTSFSNYDLIDNKKVEPCDVLFLGKAKDRLSKIYKVYQNLESQGINCTFFLVGVPPKEQIKHKGISYLDCPMDYETYLHHVKKCRCILEIEQNGAVGETLRTWEAINYNKALLTDNSGIINSTFYDSHYVRMIDDEGNVDIGFVKSYHEYENPLKDNIRPIKLLEYIQSKL